MVRKLRVFCVLLVRHLEAVDRVCDMEGSTHAILDSSCCNLLVLLRDKMSLGVLFSKNPSTLNFCSLLSVDTIMRGSIGIPGFLYLILYGDTLGS